MKPSVNLFRTCCKVSSLQTGRRFIYEKTWTKDSAVVNEVVIKDRLKALSVPFTDGYTCLHLKNCALCSQTSGSTTSDSNIFINKKTGFFVCELCKVFGHWNAYSGLLEKAKNENLDLKSHKKDWERIDKDQGNWKMVVENTSALHNLSDKDFNSVLAGFGLTPFTKKIAEKLKIRINNEINTLYFPLRCSGTVVGFKTYQKNGNTATYPRTDCSGFLACSYNWSSAVVVAQIPDYFALLSQNLPYEIICLPYGTQNLPQAILPFFEKYTKIILWLGKESLNATASIAKKLNNKRCYVVKPTENLMSASLALSKKENFTQILKNAKLTWHQFVTTFSSLRDEVLMELQNVDVVAGVPWKKFVALNKILKGHRRGELTILTGPTGAGKTTFISEYSLDLAMQGVNTLWGSFEVKNSRLARTMLTQFAGASLEEKTLPEFNALCDKFEELPIYFLTFSGQQPLSTVMDAVEHCSYTYDIAHVVIDNVQFMIEFSNDASQLDRFWKQDYMIQSFRSFASRNNCHVTLIMHPKKSIDGIDLGMNSIFGGVKASQEADNVLIIQVKENSGFGKKKFLQVCKNRFSGDLGAFALNFNRESLSFAKLSGSNQLMDAKVSSTDQSIEELDFD